MAYDIRNVKDITDLITYFAENLDWSIDIDDFEDIEDITFDFSAKDIGLQDDAFAKISSLKQLRPLVDGQPWGIFCVEFDSNRFEVTALRKILSGLVPKSRNAANHVVWDQHDLLFLCFWGSDNERTIGIAHFQEKKSGLPQIRMISCAPAKEDFTQISVFEERLSKLRWPENEEDLESWKKEWSSAFTTGYHQVIRDASTLTARLAVEAQGIRDRILEIFDIETANGYVHLLYNKFKGLLIHDMTKAHFADMYAQTVVYGLFSARCMDQTQENFSADEAIECIPNTNPFLRSLMEECFGTDNCNMSFDELEIENVVDLLRNTNTTAIMEDFNRQTGDGKEDPVIYFYEYFLSAYDKEQKVKGGDFYTPQPIVNFIVRSVDLILKKEFGIPEGMASEETKTINIMRKSKHKKDGYINEVKDKAVVPAIQILDPATGTGTFIRQTILQIYKNFCEKRKEESREDIQAAWNKYVPEHLLPRLNAFEIKMAPYAVAHMKLAMVLKDTGYDFSSDNRLKVYLTNTLEEPGSDDYQLTLFSDPLAMESVEANKTKKNNGINIVLGNPPYAGESSNKSKWIFSLIEPYKMEPGGKIKLNERNPKWINDDYVKFIRYAQTIVDKAKKGMVAYINPHGFVVNPTFRGMRWNLMQSFDEIYILDLHGNSNRKETCPDGSKDENVFDIQQGVCICFFIKKSNVKNQNSKCRVFHSDLYGTREFKYNFLNHNLISDVLFSEVFPSPPYFLFHEINYTLREKYEQGFSVNDLFTLGATGLVTARDSLSIDFTKDELLAKVNDFKSLNCEEARNKYNLGKDVQDWKVEWAQKDINNNCLDNGAFDESKIIPIMYRTLDRRYVVFTGTSRGFICRPRTKVMSQFLYGNNIGLATARSNKSETCDHFYIVDCAMEAKCAERTTQSAVFPLYYYSYAAGNIIRSVNFNMGIVNNIENAIGYKYTNSEELKSDQPKVFTELDLFYYIYGWLYSKQYRERFFEFLKSDFPIIPFPENSNVFFTLARIGYELARLHLMNGKVEIRPEIGFYSSGNNTIEKICFKEGKVYINKSSFFTGITVEDWSFMMGGYKPLQRWYKDRIGRILSQDAIDYYMKMVEVIKRTQELMDEVDNFISA